MKKTIYLCILMLYLLSLCACSNGSKTATVRFYYLDASPQYHTNATVVQPETRELSIPLSDLESIICEYLNGPRTKQFTSPFPRGTKLISIQLGKELTEVVLSDEIATLSGIDLTTACACLSATLLEISQSVAVQIKAENASLGQQESLVMDQQSIPFLG